METPAESAVRQSVLIADDDADVCTLLSLVLTPAYDITTVHDAESALELLTQGVAFDAIISDFMLPGINGLEFVERVRCSECAFARTPILMISGHGDLVDERARAAGVTAFLDKPFTLTQLRATLRSMLGIRSKSSFAA